MLETIKHDVLVDLVGKRDKVVGVTKAGQQGEVGLGHHLARRIAGRTDDDASCARGDGAGQCFAGNLPVGRRKWHQHRLYSQREQRVEVVAVIRLKQDHLIAWLTKREHCSGKSPGGTAGNHNLTAGVIILTVRACNLLRDGSSQRFKTSRRRINRFVLSDGKRCTLRNQGRSRQVTDALTQVNATHCLTSQRHSTDIRDGQLRQPRSNSHLGSVSPPARTVRWFLMHQLDSPKHSQRIAAHAGWAALLRDATRPSLLSLS